jgi:phosphoadenosine phosphosulfate reductase
VSTSTAALGIDHARLALLTRVRVPRVAQTLEAMDARTTLATALACMGGPDGVPLVTSLAPEGIVILDLLTKVVDRPRVITLDTGRLHPETYELIDRVRDRFDVDIEVISPDAADVQPMVREHGVNLMYRSREDRLRCCEVRKVQPLRRVLAGSSGWITGLRRDQASTRTSTPKIARDLANGLIWKVAPLADWSAAQVWAYVRAHDLPYNALHDEGYESIGCAPCTRPVSPGEDERSGRWWWEEAGVSRECGLHVVSPGTHAAAPAAVALT